MFCVFKGEKGVDGRIGEIGDKGKKGDKGMKVRLTELAVISCHVMIYACCTLLPVWIRRCRFRLRN